MRPGLFLAVCLTLAPLLATGAAFAQAVQPLDRLLPQIRRAHPGQFFDADGPTTNADGSQHYHLKWMTPDGRILWLDADARTGRVLGQSPGRDTFDRRQALPQPPRGTDRYFGDDDGRNGPPARGYGDNRAAPPYNGRPYDGNGSRFGGAYGGHFGNQAGGGSYRGNGNRSFGRSRAGNGR